MKKIRSIFDLEKLKSELHDVESKLQLPEVWANQKLASELGQRVRELKENIENVSNWSQIIEDAQVAFEMGDKELITDAENQLEQLKQALLAQKNRLLNKNTAFKVDIVPITEQRR